MTTEQTKAINALNRALRACEKAGINIAGMDDSLLYATNEAWKQAAKMSNNSSRGDYCNTAIAANQGLDGTGTLYSECYDDSGGW